MAQEQLVMKTLRWSSGLTQKELAEKAGISAQALRSIEHGQSRPQACTRAAIARALSVEPDDVFPPQPLVEQWVIAGLRGASGMTQKQLADKAGLDIHTVRSAEKGQHRPCARTKAAIARALSVEPDDVFPPAAQ